MTVVIDVYNACECEAPEKAQFQCWVEAALQKTIDDHVEIGIRLVESAESAELNDAYRDKPFPTNVLSFPCESLINIEPRLLGDLVICAPLIVQEAQAQNKAVQHHWAHLVIHGCLHLLGYDHSQDDDADVMESLEINILHELDIANPYQQYE